MHSIVDRPYIVLRVNMGSVQQRLLVGHIPAIASFCGEFLPFAVQLNSSGSSRCAQKCAWRRRV